MRPWPSDDALATWACSYSWATLRQWMTVRTALVANKFQHGHLDISLSMLDTPPKKKTDKEPENTSWKRRNIEPDQQFLGFQPLIFQRCFSLARADSADQAASLHKGNEKSPHLFYIISSFKKIIGTFSLKKPYIYIVVNVFFQC